MPTLTYHPPARRERPDRRWLLGLAICCLLTGVLAAPAQAEPGGSGVRSFQAGLLDAGNVHSCAVLRDGSASCWGASADGRLGTGADPTPGVPAAVLLPAEREAVALSAGVQHTCAVLDDGGAACWGYDGDGQLGDDATLASQPLPVPVALPQGRSAVAISAGHLHSCAILDDGSAACWGADTIGQLGNGATLTAQPTPVAVALPAGRTATAISAGYFHTCAILDDGGATCWGSDGNGQLGADNPGAYEPTPVRVELPPGRSAVAISSGGYHACAILDDGSAACWGFDSNGQLGNDVPLADRQEPGQVALPAGRTAVAITAGDAHSCAVLDDGKAMCWGRDTDGRLGDDATIADRPTPVAVPLPGARRAVAIAAGGPHTCVFVESGSVTCWGDGASGALGNGSTAPQPVASAAPAALPSGAAAGRVADVSVQILDAPTSLAVDGSAIVRVRVVNAGPDAVSGLRVAITSSRLDVATLAVGEGSFAAGTWNVGTILPATVELTLRITALAAGEGAIAAEVVTHDQRDPDSRPANGAPAEDDRDARAIPIRPAGAPLPRPSTDAPGDRAAVDRLTVRLVARRRGATTTLTARGSLRASAVTPRAACTGTVTVTVSAGRVLVASANARLKLRQGTCTYRTPLRLAREPAATRRLRAVARFAGNDALRPAVARTLTVLPGTTA